MRKNVICNAAHHLWRHKDVVCVHVCALKTSMSKGFGVFLKELKKVIWGFALKVLIARVVENEEDMDSQSSDV